MVTKNFSGNPDFGHICSMEIPKIENYALDNIILSITLPKLSHINKWKKLINYLIIKQLDFYYQKWGTTEQPKFTLPCLVYNPQYTRIKSLSGYSMYIQDIYNDTIQNLSTNFSTSHENTIYIILPNILSKNKLFDLARCNMQKFMIGIHFTEFNNMIDVISDIANNPSQVVNNSIVSAEIMFHYIKIPKINTDCIFRVLGTKHFMFNITTESAIFTIPLIAITNQLDTLFFYTTNANQIDNNIINTQISINNINLTDTLDNQFTNSITWKIKNKTNNTFIHMINIRDYIYDILVTEEVVLQIKVKFKNPSGCIYIELKERLLFKLKTNIFCYDSTAPSIQSYDDTKNISNKIENMDIVGNNVIDDTDNDSDDNTMIYNSDIEIEL